MNGRRSPLTTRAASRYIRRLDPDQAGAVLAAIDFYRVLIRSGAKVRMTVAGDAEISPEIRTLADDSSSPLHLTGAEHDIRTDQKTMRCSELFVSFWKPPQSAAPLLLPELRVLWLIVTTGNYRSLMFTEMRAICRERFCSC